VPTTIVNKGFSFSQGQVTLEVTLDKDIYYHGERVAARINVTNTSRKSVKSIRVRLGETGWSSYAEYTFVSLALQPIVVTFSQPASRL
jgi:hypothetical protein